MGWASWNCFFCSIDQNVTKQQADALVSYGMAAVGYRYVNLGDGLGGLCEGAVPLAVLLDRAMGTLTEYPHPRRATGLVPGGVGPAGIAGERALSNLEQGARNATGDTLFPITVVLGVSGCPAGGRFLGGEPLTALGHFRADPSDALTDGRGA
jgi:hypothetical protein